MLNSWVPSTFAFRYKIEKRLFDSVNVHKMAINRKVLYKQYAGTLPKHFMAFLRTLEVVLTMPQR